MLVCFQSAWFNVPEVVPTTGERATDPETFIIYIQDSSESWWGGDHWLNLHTLLNMGPVRLAIDPYESAGGRLRTQTSWHITCFLPALVLHTHESRNDGSSNYVCTSPLFLCSEPLIHRTGARQQEGLHMLLVLQNRQDDNLLP